MTLSVAMVDRLCLAALAAIGLACGAAAFSGAAQQHRQAQELTRSLRKVAGDLSAAEDTVQQLRRVVDEVRRDVEDVDRMISQRGKTAVFLKQLDSVTAECGVSMVSFRPLAPQKEEKYTRCPIGVMFSGPFANLYHMVQVLETRNRAMKIEELLVAREPGSPACRMEMTASFVER